MTSDNRTCIKILLALAIAFYGLWSWDARAEFDPYCWEPNFTIHYICNGGWCYK